MKGTYIGELEELVLLIVGVLYKDAYGVAVMDEIEKTDWQESEHKWCTCRIKHVLKRRIFWYQKMSDPTGERGGRRKTNILVDSGRKTRIWKKPMKWRNQLFNQIPNVALQFKLV